MSLLMLFVCQGVRLLCLLDCSIILELMQIATIIGHEVGHVVARHAAEGIIENFWVAILQLNLFQFIMPDCSRNVSSVFEANFLPKDGRSAEEGGAILLVPDDFKLKKG
uniref:Peptidase M48 domain-containing protein n=1 Tax=Populus trichocarpa TaxID=3694 RepID=A0A3N7G2H9_POPTR